MFVISCVVYCFECVYVLFCVLCIVVQLPPGTNQFAVNNNNNYYYYYYYYSETGLDGKGNGMRPNERLYLNVEWSFVSRV